MKTLLSDKLALSVRFFYDPKFWIQLSKALLIFILCLCTWIGAKAQSISYKPFYDFSVGLTHEDFYAVGTEEGAPNGISFNDDGTRMFIIGYGSDAVQQYSLSSPYDITSTVEHEGSYNVSAETNTPRDVDFSDDGMRMYILGTDTRQMHEYTLSAAYDITSTVTYTTNTRSISGWESLPLAVEFSADGLKAFFVGAQSKVYETRMSTPFDVATGSAGVWTYTEDLSAGDLRDIRFSPDGRTMYLLDEFNDILKVELNVAFDLYEGYTEYGSVFNTSDNETETWSMAFGLNGSRLLTSEISDDRVNQYNFNNPTFYESLANDGSIETAVTSFALDGETFNNPGGNLTYGSDFSIANLPAGFSAIFSVEPEGTFGTLTFSGSTALHQIDNNISGLVFTFENSAFAGDDASAVANAVGHNSGINIDFRNNGSPFISFGGYADLSKATHEGVTSSLATEDNQLTGMAFSSDGMKVFITGSQHDAIYQYNLSSPFDITQGVSYSNNSVDISGDDTAPLGLAFNPTGTKMFVVGALGDEVMQYSLSSPFDLSSTVENEGSPFSLAAQTYRMDITFSHDGLLMFIPGEQIFAYALNTPFDITTGGTLVGELDHGIAAFATDVEFSPDGMTLYASSGSSVVTFQLEAPYSLNQQVGKSVSTSFSSYETSIMSIEFGPDRQKLFVAGTTGDDLNQFMLPILPLEESITNNGTLEGSRTIRIADDKFTKAGSTLTAGVDFTTTGVPAGLSPVLTVASDGLSADLTFSGQATSHGPAANIEDIVFTFSNSAFVDSDANDVLYAVGSSSHYSMEFIDANASVFHANGFKIDGTVNYTGFSMSVRSQASNPSGFAFSTDGMKMYVVDQTSRTVFQYSLSAPFVTYPGMSYDEVTYAVGQDTAPKDVEFSEDGTKMYIVGDGNNRIYQHTLSTPFDLSTASYGDTHLIVTNEETTPDGMCFSKNGRRLYVIGNGSGNMVHQYRLSQPYDLSSEISLVGEVEVSFVSIPTGVFVSPDGLTLQAIGTGGDLIYQYNMSVPHDVSSAVYALKILNVRSKSNSPADLTFSSDGSRVIIIGSNYDNVDQWEIDTDDFQESASTPGAVEGAISLSIVGDQFSNAGGSLSNPDDFLVPGLPTGLVPNMTISEDGLTATLTFTGSAESHQNNDGISDLVVTFEDGAFDSGDASGTLNADINTGANINFANDATLVYSNGYTLVNDPVFFASVPSYDTGSKSVALSADGYKMYVVGDNNEIIHQYTLLHPFEPGKGYNLNGSFTLPGSSQEAITFNNDGTSYYYLSGADYVAQVSLSTPWDILSDRTSVGTFDFSSQDTGASDVTFNDDGTKMYMIGFVSDAIHQYSLDKPFDLSTGVSYDNVSYDISAQATFPRSLDFNADGSRLFMHGSNGIFEYHLSNPFDISTGITYTGNNYTPSEGAGFGFELVDGGNKMIVVNANNIYQYNFEADGFVESANNDGTLDGLIGIQLGYDTFVNAGATLAPTTHFTLTGIPTGLTPTMTVATDGKSVSLRLEGAVSSHQDSDDVSNIQISFTDAAFTSTSAAAVINAINYDTGFGIDFQDNNAHIIYGKALNFDESLPKLKTTYSVATQSDQPNAMTMNPEGTKMYVIDYNSETISQYILTIPFDLTSMSFDNSLDLSAEISAPAAICFSSNGQKMFIQSFNNIHYQYTMNTAYDVSAGATLAGTFTSSSQGLQSSGFWFKPDGTKMWITSSADNEVNQYSLETPFDITAGVSYDGYSLSVTTRNYTSLIFSSDGKSLFIGNGPYPGSAGITQYGLNVPFDLTGGTEYIRGFNVHDITGSPQGIFLNQDETKFYVLGSTDDSVFEFDLEIDDFAEGNLNDGSVEGALEIRIVDEPFTNADGHLTHGSDYSITNLPAGLNPQLAVAADGYSATLTFEGKANAHQDINDVGNLSFTFSNSAFVNGDVSAVANAIASASNRSIDFRDNVPGLTYGDVYDLGMASHDASPYDMSGQDSDPTDLSFSTDGSKLFVSGNNSDMIHQYSLTSPFNATNIASYDGGFDNSAQDESVEDLAFSADGMRMFLLGGDNYNVYQYNLTTAFDITDGVTFSGNAFNFEVYGQDTYAFTFNADGTKMYIASTSDYEIFQFSLSSPYDLGSTITDDGDPLITADESTEFYASPTGIVFSADGRYLMMTQDGDDYNIMRYILNVPFDVTQGALRDLNVYDLDQHSIWGSGIALSADGSHVFVTNGDDATIEGFTIDVGGFIETGANDGTVTGSMEIAIFDDTFSSMGGTFASGSDYTITNLPTGLIPTLTVAEDGYSATLTLSGNAVSNANANDISGLVFNFMNSAFTNSSASDVANAENSDSKIGIDFLANTGNDILTFSFATETGPATIDAENHSVDIEITFTSDITNLIPDVTVSDGADYSPNGATNFTDPTTITVTAEDGTPQDWLVTVTKAPLSMATDIISFIAEGQTGPAIVDAINHTVEMEVLFGTEVANLAPTITVSPGGSISPNSEVSRDFNDPVVYTVTAEDATTTQDWTVTVTIAPNDATDILSFTLAEQSAEAAIDDSNHTVDITVVAGTDVSSLSPSFTVSPGGTVVPSSGTAQDFTDPIVYTVTGQDGITEQEWTVTVEVELFTGTEILSFVLGEQTQSAEIDNINNTVEIEVAYGTDLTNLSPTITVSAGASISPLGAQDFSEAVIYTVTAEETTITEAWTVTVTEAPSNETDILTFVLDEQTEEASINADNHTVAIEVANGTDLSSLEPALTVSAGATISPSGVQDFSQTVSYTVTAENEITTQTWSVTVTEAPSSATDILTFELAAQTGAATIDITNHTIGVEVEFGTDLTSLEPAITVSDGATLSPSGAQNFTNSFTYTVIAEDESTSQEWVVTVTEEDQEVLAASELDFKLKVYPNPATDQILVEGLTNDTKVEVIDLRGQTVLYRSIKNMEYINLTNLKSGLYHVRFTNDKISTTTRLLIRK